MGNKVDKTGMQSNDIIIIPFLCPIVPEKFSKTLWGHQSWKERKMDTKRKNKTDTRLDMQYDITTDPLPQYHTSATNLSESVRSFQPWEEWKTDKEKDKTDKTGMQSQQFLWWWLN